MMAKQRIKSSVERMRILISEDDAVSQRVLKFIISREGHETVVVGDGAEALAQFRRKRFDVVLTDWMMPEMDGIGLIREIRAMAGVPPIVLMVTALDSVLSRQHALDAGADDFVAKPYKPEDILELIENCRARQQQKPLPVVALPKSTGGGRSSLAAVCFAASTGGPPALVQVFENLDVQTRTAFFIVQHGPAWMLEDFAKRLNQVTKMPAVLAEHDMPVQGGEIYIAPGKKHLVLDSNGAVLQLDDGPRVNFVKPSADVLFKSAAKAFGSDSLAVVMTGLGRDGTLGAAHIGSVGGDVLVQNPSTAVAPFMPQSVIENRQPCLVSSLPEMPEAIQRLLETRVGNVQKA